MQLPTFPHQWPIECRFPDQIPVKSGQLGRRSTSQGAPNTIIGDGDWRRGDPSRFYSLRLNTLFSHGAIVKGVDRHI